MGGILDGPMKSVVEAGKGNIDYIAFATIAALSVVALIGRVAFSSAAGIAVVFAAIWIVMRFALLKLQSREKLRDLQDRVTIEAQRKIAEYATKDEIADLFAEGLGDGGSDAR